MECPAKDLWLQITVDQPKRTGRARGSSMNIKIAPPTRTERWKELYRAALFEPDRGKCSERIEKAERALALRARELFHSASENLPERQVVDATMYALGGTSP
jgi:hypothetical protein